MQIYIIDFNTELTRRGLMCLQVIMGGGRQMMIPDTMPDPEYPEQRGKRLDGQNLMQV